MLRVLESKSSTASGMPDQGDAVLRLRLGRWARDFHGKLPAASGMTCARREAGAPRPAASAEPVPSLSRGSTPPEPRAGRRRARSLIHLPVAALLLGALSLFAAAPAEAQVPSGPRNVQVTAGNASLTLTWQAPSNWGGGTTPRGYEVDWATGATAPALDSSDWKEGTPLASPLASSATSFSFTGTYGGHVVTNGIKYWLRIRAFTTNPTDPADTFPSVWSTPISGTPQAAQRGCDPAFGTLTVAPHRQGGSAVGNALAVHWTGSRTGVVYYFPKNAPFMAHSFPDGETNIGNMWFLQDTSPVTGSSSAPYIIRNLNPIDYKVYVMCGTAFGSIGGSKYPNFPVPGVNSVVGSATPTGSTLPKRKFGVADYPNPVRSLNAVEASKVHPRNPWTKEVNEGNSTSYKLSLGGKPSTNVTVTPRVADSSQADLVTFSPASFTFTTPRYDSNGDVVWGETTSTESPYHTFPTITVTAANVDADTTIRIVHDLQSEDLSYTSAYMNKYPQVNQFFIKILNKCANCAIAETLAVYSRVEISAGQDVTEGADAAFTVTATPAPPVDLEVSVDVSQSGDFAKAGVWKGPTDRSSPRKWQPSIGRHTVTIPAGGTTATLTVPTKNDLIDEPDGSVTAALAEGTGYAVAGGAATVAVADNEDPLEVSIAGITETVTEGQRASFRVTANRAPAVDLRVSVNVSMSGDFTRTDFFGRPMLPSSVFIPRGATTATLTVPTKNDEADEPDGSVTAALAEGTGYSVAATGGTATVAVADNDDAPLANAQQGENPPPPPLVAAFERVPDAHDGKETFWLNVRFSEALGEGGAAPTAKSFAVEDGTVKRVRRIEPGLWRVRIKPASWKDVTVTLAGSRACGETGAVCAAGGRTLSNTASATVGGPVRLRISGGKAREGRNATLDFAVTLNRAAAHAVSVDYATADGTAKAGADYTAASGTLAFAPGETAMTVSVAILDDAIDEGKETFLLKLSNPQGAFLRSMHREAKGVIRNDDPLQAMWLSRFGRMVASDAVAAVTARLETPRTAGSHLTMLGQQVNLSQAEDGAGDEAGAKALTGVLTGLAQTFGAPNAPAADADDPFARHGLTNDWNDPAVASPARRVTARELLLGTSFRAVLANGPGMQLTSWGQGASVSRFSAAVPGLGLTGEAATGSMGFDYERGRLLAGFAVTHTLGEGAASDAGWRYRLGSMATTVLPYARLKLTERVSAWGMAGTGRGSLSLDLDGNVPQRYRTDLAMTLTAMGVRGDLVTPTEAGGFALALKADAFWVSTESDRVSSSEFGNLAAARGESSRVRAVLDGSRTFALAGGATLAPSVELGVRHDGGDAETGTGVELGAGLGYADPSRGLDMALRVHGLSAHAGDGYSEWGVSGSLRLAPGGAGRGLSASLTPSYGVDPGGSQRLWMLPDASGLAADEDAVPSSRLDAEVGYGMAVFGGSFTGTPHVGFGLSEAGRDWRVGWRLTSGASSLDLSLEATRREFAAGNGAGYGAGTEPEHMLGVHIGARF